MSLYERIQCGSYLSSLSPKEESSLKQILRVHKRCLKFHSGCPLVQINFLCLKSIDWPIILFINPVVSLGLLGLHLDIEFSHPWFVSLCGSHNGELLFTLVYLFSDTDADTTGLLVIRDRYCWSTSNKEVFSIYFRFSLIQVNSDWPLFYCKI